MLANQFSFGLTKILNLFIKKGCNFGGIRVYLKGIHLAFRLANKI